MKNVSIAGLICLGCLLTLQEAKAQTQENTKPTEVVNVDKNSAVVNLTVEGMTCQAGCADGIDKMLGKKEGVSESKTTYATGSSIIRYDTSVISEKEILALIAEKGFKAAVSKNDKVDPDY
jgi:copper chaperone